MIHPPIIIHHNPFVKPTINQYSSSGHRWSVTPSELNQPGNHGLELNWWTRSWLSYKLKITINIQLWMFFMIFIMPCQSLGSLMFFNHPMMDVLMIFIHITTQLWMFWWYAIHFWNVRGDGLWWSLDFVWFTTADFLTITDCHAHGSAVSRLSTADPHGLF